MHPIRTVKEKIGSAFEEIAVTTPQIVKDAVVAASDKVKDFNEKVLEPEEQRFAEEHDYTHGGTREKIAKHLIGVSKYETGAKFLNDHVVDPMRPKHDQEDSSSSPSQNV
ncbi:hypothetical protein I4U23_025953 [Adineta vaga]|nr:hypothetical protein I4U23_025953 [Adineta vaga]